MKTIAISRLIGSGAAQVALRVTDVLGYTVVNKSVLEGIFRQYGLTKFGELYTSPPNVWDMANATNLLIVSMLNEIMEALAYRGQMLILGRGGYSSLSKYADVLNVRLQAPFPVRVERLMARENQPDRWRTEQLVKADDTARQEFVARFYNEGWDIASNFDLVIDTHIISTEMAGDWIVEATQALDQKTFGADVVTAQRAKVDPTLLEAIDIALAHQLPSVDEDFNQKGIESETPAKPEG
ncbi:MAG TPA: cytidylate kinase-like family protein [Chthoniobacterales bacterium]